MTTPAVTLAAVLAVLPMVVWEGPPPDCERLGRDIVTWGASVEMAARAAQKVAAKRGADTLYIILTEPRGGYQYCQPETP